MFITTSEVSSERKFISIYFDLNGLKMFYRRLTNSVSLKGFWNRHGRIQNNNWLTYKDLPKNRSRRITGREEEQVWRYSPRWVGVFIKSM